MNFENLNIWCWLIPALVGIICGILGYFIGKESTTLEDNSGELERLRAKNNTLQTNLDTCTKNLSAANKVAEPTQNLGTSAAAFAGGVVTSPIPFNAASAKAIFGKNIKNDDLKVVEGIGPKIEGMFKESGIKTWKALSDASVADCQKILDKGGSRYQIHDPASWPMQAKMCYEGKWEDLLKWQTEHKHGKL